MYRAVRFVGLQRGATDQRDRDPHGVGGTAERRAVDGGQECPSVSVRGNSRGTTSRVDGVTVGELDAVRLEARRSRDHGDRDSVTRRCRISGCVLSGTAWSASRSNDGIAPRVKNFRYCDFKIPNSWSATRRQSLQKIEAFCWPKKVGTL